MCARSRTAEALSDTSGIVYPKSHMISLGEGGVGHYKLKKADFEQLRDQRVERTELALAAGDLLIFAGGTMVHESPAVPEGEPPRFMTYSKFSAAGPAHAQPYSR
jgi:hypothetical protein